MARVVPAGALGTRRARYVVERNLLVFRRGWLVLLSGFFEPFFYLLSTSAGIAKLVGPITFEGRTVAYTAFVAPALLASSAMNGAVYESTFNIFFKLRYQRTYEGILATPVAVGDIALGEIGWALMRGSVYACAFTVIMWAMGLLLSWWAVLAVPTAVLIGFAFSATGLAATTFMRSWQDTDLVQIAILPLFLFSATFYPLSTYPGALQWVVRATPLYHGVALMRGLTTGAVSPALAVHAAYLLGLGLLALAVASRRLRLLLLK